MKLFLSLAFCILFLFVTAHGQEELPTSGDGSGEGSGAAEPVAEASGDGSGEAAADEAESSTAEGGESAAEASGGDEAAEEGDDADAAAEEEGEVAAEESEEGDAEEESEGSSPEDAPAEAEEDCEESGDASGSGDDEILTPKCSKKESSGEEVDSEEGGEEGNEAESNEEGTCDVEGMDENIGKCLSDYGSRIKDLEDTISSEEGGGLEDQIELVLVKKGVIDCENDTQCDDDKACLESRVKRDRVLCEDPCERNHCPVQHSECVVRDHKFSCECKEGFHGNGTERCVPDGFTAEENGKHYRIFDDSYVEFDNATEQCEELGARLPVLDSQETIKIVKKYLEDSNFTVFEQWDRSSRRVWLGLILDPRSGLIWADGARIANYPASSRLFVWEARRALSAEASYADHSRHYGLYIDGDIAKLPGGGRRGAAVLCELVPPPERPEAPSRPNYDSPQNQGYYGGNQPNYYSQQPNYPQQQQYPQQPQQPPYYSSQQQQPTQPQNRPPGYPNYPL